MSDLNFRLWMKRIATKRPKSQNKNGEFNKVKESNGLIPT